MGSDQKRAVLAVVLSGIILLGWQFLYGPNEKKSTKTAITEVAKSAEQKSEAQIPVRNETIVPKNLETITLRREENFFEIDSTLKIINAATHSSTKSFATIFDGKNNNQIQFVFDGVPTVINFSLTKISDEKIEFQNVKYQVTGFVQILENGMLDFSIDSQTPFKLSFTMNEKAVKEDNGQIKSYVLLSDDLDILPVGDDEEGEKSLSWFGLDFHYHLFAFVFPNKMNAIYRSKENGTFKARTSGEQRNLNFQIVYTKKEYDTLMSFKNNLHRSVDLGMMSIVAVPILRGLQFFYTVFPNYGISIILLTILIRMLTFPLQYKSFKSMKKMQDVQPELKIIREKFKSDPKKLQVETMALFKKAGANPLGGCLPLILQMPIFFAFYRVLYSAVELDGAPFYFWIHDLSLKDPYYVLPVLMAVAMFFQQKLTPTQTADPAQQKIMMFMPLIFAVFMKDMPAGLTLYIFVSTVLGMAQQLFVYKRT